MSACSLCELPTPDPPVTAADVEGSFCCRGCLEVSRALGDVDDLDREAIRERAESPDEESGDETAGGDSATERTVPDGAAEVFLAVEGMHCATCEGFVSLLGEREDGILSVEASYATDTARVVYEPDHVDPDALPETLSGYGYETRFRGGDGRGERLRRGAADRNHFRSEGLRTSPRRGR